MKVTCIIQSRVVSRTESERDALNDKILKLLKMLNYVRLRRERDDDEEGEEGDARVGDSKTIVWWDMDSCPLPNGYEPSRVGPRIDTELKNQGYNGPLTIIGIGNLEGVPHDFLIALSSGGVVIKQLPLAVTEHADPEPPTLLVDNFGGEWVWDRLGLLKDPGSPNYDTRRQDTGCESHCCGLCDDFSSDSFDDFKAHFDSPQHADKSYLAKVEAKRREFVTWFGLMILPSLRRQGKKFKAALLCKASSLKKKATAKPKKPSKASFSNKSTDFSLTTLTCKDILHLSFPLSKRLAIAEEAECSLPKNAATTMSS
ncbi:hypothetical protein HID58_022429 [Brassica napus]|uniref:NYN domain-containing protein n=1 Tax=Brassica napus TaxID=3708 RepID=A0ABQ8CZ94_BRANA|nr:hypothetical protein HID58_022429 [Brassica napus]